MFKVIVRGITIKEFFFNTLDSAKQFVNKHKFESPFDKCEIKEII